MVIQKFGSAPEMAKPRIAIAGFQHETNCFGVTKADLADFQMADSWPEMLWGDRVIRDTRGMNLPIAGFAAAAEVAGFDVAPILWCAAEPSAHVTDDAFETITARILDGLQTAGPLDGVYLDLHGAMVTESFADGEGEILRRVRNLIGTQTPLIASLDLHANISAEMCDLSDYLAIFRTYPHLDMAETGARCVPLMQRLLNGERPCKAFRQVPYLIPLHAQFTGTSPFRDLYALLPDPEHKAVQADIALGFTAADFPDTGPSCVAYAETTEQAEATTDALLAAFLSIENQVDRSMLSLDEAVRAAHHDMEWPLVLADVQDNPGAGGTADTTGLLKAMRDGRCERVLMGLFHDPEIAAKAHAVGPGGHFRAALGGKSGLTGDFPLDCDFEVLSLSDGQCRYSGEMYGGGVATLGQSAALRVIGGGAQIDLVVTSIRNQCLDLAQFTHFGLKPDEYKTICVKSTVHYRAAFDPICGDVKSVASPGAFVCDLAKVPFRNLHPEKAGRRIAAEVDLISTS
jgi:microcystin degradation protein MlrC